MIEANEKIAGFVEYTGVGIDGSPVQGGAYILYNSRDQTYRWDSCIDGPSKKACVSLDEAKAYYRRFIAHKRVQTALWKEYSAVESRATHVSGVSAERPKMRRTR